MSQLSATLRLKEKPHEDGVAVTQRWTCLCLGLVCCGYAQPQHLQHNENLSELELTGEVTHSRETLKQSAVTRLLHLFLMECSHDSDRALIVLKI